MSGRRMFSATVTDGASSVAAEHDMIAESSAPKKITCATNGACVEDQRAAGSAASRSSM